MNLDFSYFFTGAIIGIGAGAAPGPLTMLVITQTLRHGLREGIQIAIAPLITDFPIIFLSVAIFSKLENTSAALAAISFAGSAILLMLAKENFTAKATDPTSSDLPSRSIKKGVLTNFLSPHPYIFWMSVGTPIIGKAMEVNFASAALFVLSMLGTMIGIKIILAMAIKQSSSFLRGKPYLFLLRGAGIAMLFFALNFMIDGFKHLGIL